MENTQNHFLKIGNHMFNRKYIKSFHCDTNFCDIVIANTENSSLSLTGINNYRAIDAREDKCMTFPPSSQEYRDLWNLINMQ